MVGMRVLIGILREKEDGKCIGGGGCNFATTTYTINPSCKLSTSQPQQEVS